MEKRFSRLEKILSAIARSGEILLSTASLDEGISSVLEEIGNAVEVDRVYLFENMQTSDGRLLTSLKYEWCAPGIAPRIRDPNFQDFEFSERWVETMKRGESICGNVKDFPVEEQKMLILQDIKSILVIPVFVRKEWYGFVGFDSCKKERKWKKYEIDALKSVIGLITQAIERHITKEEEIKNKNIDHLTTGIKRAEKELKRAYDLINTISNFAGIADLEGRLRFVNRKVIEILGFREDEVIGKFFWECPWFTPSDEIVDVIKESIQASLKGEIRKREIVVFTKDGKKIPIYFTSTPMIDENGEIVRVALEGIDISELKEKERALQKSEAGYRDLIERMNEGLGVIDKNGYLTFVNPTKRELEKQKEFLENLIETANIAIVGFDPEGRITFCNKKWEETTGYSEEEIVEKTFFEAFIPKKYLKEAPLIFKAVLAERIPGPHEVKIITRDGEERIFIWSGTVIRDERGTPIGLVAFGEDITEKKRLEKELKKSYEELKKSNEAKAEFINIMAHELRTPLTVIMGYLDMLKDTVTSWKGREILRIIERNAEQLNDIISEAFLVLRADAGGIEVKKEEISVQELIEELVEDLRDIYGSKEQKIVVDTKNIVIKADRKIMEKIFTNLISNAMKFAPDDGKIEICAEKTDGKVLFSVSDTGEGIPDEEKEKIFERFYQIEPSLTRRHGGVGLGLSIVKELVRVHGGRVWVEDNPGGGSVFYVELLEA
ncbi:MAG: PAS domain S-box protein [Candidatus Syntropharchaeia archaeon]